MIAISDMMAKSVNLAYFMRFNALVTLRLCQCGDFVS
jgi:hypothetical protein